MVTKAKAKKAATNRAPKSKSPKSAASPRLLKGGNPQIAKAEGDAPVQAYIAALPGWKKELATRLDAIIMRTVPRVTKAVKWNSPLYGVEGQGWFVGMHAFTKYLKVTFFDGAALRPPPPGESKNDDVRHYHIHEGDVFDEARFASWVKQASRLPGWVTSGVTTAPAKKGKDTPMTASKKEPSPSQLIDGRIAELADWRGKTLARVRALIKAADPEVEETWKWRGVPVWEHGGILCTGETYKAAVKLTFAKGAALADPKKLFNASLEGNARRAIDIHEGETLDEAAFKELVRAAVALNTSKAKKK